MDDTFDITFGTLPEESDTHRAIRVEKEFACKALGVLRIFLVRLYWGSPSLMLPLFSSVSPSSATGYKLVKFF